MICPAEYGSILKHFEMAKVLQQQHVVLVVIVVLFCCCFCCSCCFASQLAGEINVTCMTPRKVCNAAQKCRHQHPREPTILPALTLPLSLSLSFCNFFCIWSKTRTAAATATVKTCQKLYAPATRHARDFRLVVCHFTCRQNSHVGKLHKVERGEGERKKPTACAAGLLSRAAPSVNGCSGCCCRRCQAKKNDSAN